MSNMNWLPKKSNDSGDFPRIAFNIGEHSFKVLIQKSQTLVHQLGFLKL